MSLVQADGQWLPLCTGFGTIEDVAVDKGGNVYVTEDVNGLIVQILVTDRIPPQPPMNLVASPPGWTATNVFSLTWQNPTDPSGIAGAYLKLDTPPSAAADGTLYPGAALTQVLSLTAAPGAHPAYPGWKMAPGMPLPPTRPSHSCSTIPIHRARPGPGCGAG